MANIGSYSGQTDHGGWNFTNIQGFEGGPSGQYSISNDTVYLYTWFNGALLNPRIAFLPVAVIADTATYVVPWPWSQTKVYSLGRSMATPAGNFDSVYVYECDLSFNERYLTYFKPGVGVISTESYAPTLIDRTVLVAYNLAQ